MVEPGTGIDRVGDGFRQHSQVDEAKANEAATNCGGVADRDNGRNDANRVGLIDTLS